MKTSYLILLLSLIGSTVLFSCRERLKTENNTSDSCCIAGVTADSLIQRWNDAWNTKDSIALKNMFMENATVLVKDFVITGRDSIMIKWINENLPLVKNLKTESLKQCNCCCCVSMTGFYSLDVASGESTIEFKGNFTFIWNQVEDKSWKLKVVHMHQF